MLRLPELEIGLARRDKDTFLVELRFNDPQNPELRTPALGAFQPPERQLLQHALDPEAYGAVLFKALLADAQVLKLYDQARAVTRSSGLPVRMRLFIHPEASELHALHWEKLFDERPGGGWLLTDERLRFSRFLSSDRGERVAPRAREELRALVVIANPHDLESGEYEIGGESLAPVDVQSELQRAREGLGELFSEDHLLVSDPSRPGTVTLDALREQVRVGYDILYLVCHGAVLEHARKPGAHILLENADGSGEFTSGNEVSLLIQNVDPDLRPRLVVLASCQSAGKGGEAVSADTQGVLSALGPLVSRAGVPAVIAMQGNISMSTSTRFVGTFFKELLSDESGQLDRAMAVARSAVRERPDSWTPVLFMRLLSGSLWYLPGFASLSPDFRGWPAVMASLKIQKCSPILGTKLSAPVTGSSRQIANLWAQKYHYPLTEDGQDRLQVVAQFNADNTGSVSVPRLDLAEHITNSLVDYFDLGERPKNYAQWLDEDLLKEIGQKLVGKDHPGSAAGAGVRQIYATLACLPVTLYINTGADILLEAALYASGKRPVSEYMRWNRDVSALKSNLPNGADPYRPSIDQPLVFHPFGLISEPLSLVVSEDDYFEFMACEMLPMVETIITYNALMFLGFDINDWGFRVLYRGIPERRKGSEPSVAVQVSPDEHYVHPDLARQHLEQHFLGARMGIYWGSESEFCQRLAEMCEAKGIYE